MSRNGDKREVYVLIDQNKKILSKSKMFKVKTLVNVLDSLIPHLTNRAEALSSIVNMLSFFSNLKTIYSVQPNKKCKKLTSVYHINFDYGDPLNKCTHLKHYITLDEKCDTFPALYRELIAGNLKSMFPNVKIPLRVF